MKEKFKCVCAAEWFAKASAEGAFYGRYVEVALDRKPEAPIPVDIFENGKWIKVWSDTGKPYNPKSYGGR